VEGVGIFHEMNWASLFHFHNKEHHMGKMYQYPILMPEVLHILL
jgi:hypothetical protein